MTTVEKLYKTVQELPEPVISEILDFAEFLSKKQPARNKGSDTSLLDLVGGLENSIAFHGDPLVIQKQLRNEWD
jgi:hypothetical protein